MFIDSDKLIVGEVRSFHIVNIDKCVIEKKIEEDKALGYLNCFLKLRDNNTILCGGKNGIFCFYDMKKDEYKTTKSNHTKDINILLLVDDNTFLSCSRDKTIKVWKY